jgi:hypothetical protein
MTLDRERSVDANPPELCDGGSPSPTAHQVVWLMGDRGFQDLPAHERVQLARLQAFTDGNAPKPETT